MWLDFSNTGLSHESIKNKLINEAKLALNDGIGFGKNGAKYFRLNIATPRQNLETALEKLKVFKQ
jgi:cystathionine beta-lyase